MKRRDKVYLFSLVFAISIILNIKYILNVGIPWISIIIAIGISYPFLRWFNKKGMLIIKEKPLTLE